MAEEIKIVAQLDTSDVADGVQRINAAIGQVKASVEQAATSSAAAGAKAGDGFMKSFAGRILASMLVRDAIRESLAIAQQAFEDFQKDINFAVGNPQEKSRSLTQWFADVMFADPIKRAVLVQGGLPGALAGVGFAGISASNADAQRAAFIQQAKDNPSILGSTSELEFQLGGIIGQRGSAAHKNAEDQARARAKGDPAAGAAAEAAFKTMDRTLSEAEAQARELVSLGKERDRRSAEADKKAYGTGYSGTSPEHAESFMEGEIRKQHEEEARKAAEAAAKATREKAEADRKAAELSKRKTELGLSQEEHDLGKSQGGLDRDLDFTEKQLRSQKATSVATIHGGLYGRNDSASVMVQHAAQTVSKLTSIDETLKEIRAQRNEMTFT